MRFIVIGSGAVGGYFGAQLQQAGHEVVFMARGAQLRALRDNGLVVCHGDVETRLHPVDATDTLDGIPPADVVLICVKTWQLDDIIPQLPALRHADTRFLTLQNGVEAPGAVGAAVGVGQTLGGLVRGFFELEAPGRIRHVGVQPTIIFGQMDGQKSPQAVALLDALTEAGIYAELSGDIERALWEKFLLVTSLSGVGAVTRASIGEVRAHPATRALLRQVMAEIVAVGQARGVSLSEDAADKTLAFVGTFPPESTTSMQRDIMHGQPSELEAQTGAVVRLGRDSHVPTPANRFLYTSLLLQEQQARLTR